MSVGHVEAPSRLAQPTARLRWRAARVGKDGPRFDALVHWGMVLELGGRCWNAAGYTTVGRPIDESAWHAEAVGIGVRF